MHHFLANFEKLVQKIVISGNCLQFPEVPTKISEIFNEKSAISRRVSFRYPRDCAAALPIRTLRDLRPLEI